MGIDSVAGGGSRKPTDSELVAAIARGQTQALKELTQRYGCMVLGLARRFVGDEHEAEEVAADVFWQIWREAGLYEPARGSVVNWIVIITRSRAIDRMRALRARKNLEEESAQGAAEGQDPIANAAAAEGSDPFSTMDSAERAELVRQALKKLEPNERVVLELAYFTDLSQSQIAERLNIPIGTVKTWIRRALFKLRDELGQLKD